MVWYVCVAYFFAGAFLANGVPHFVRGVCGQTFQSPFASPPGVGESSALVNVWWGAANFAIGYVLVTAVGDFRSGLTFDTLFVLLGVLVMGSMCARHFGKVRGHQP